MRLVLLVTALLVAGCELRSPYLPDGGRARVYCDEGTQLNVPVKMLDRDGEPFSGAVLTVDYTSLEGEDRVALLTADDRGQVLVEDRGPGVVRISSNYRGFTIEPKELTFNGSDCSTTVTPRQLTVQFN